MRRRMGIRNHSLDLLHNRYRSHACVTSVREAIPSEVCDVACCSLFRNHSLDPMRRRFRNRSLVLHRKRRRMPIRNRSLDLLHNHCHKLIHSRSSVRLAIHNPWRIRIHSLARRCNQCHSMCYHSRHP